jgi:hypothetical protein
MRQKVTNNTINNVIYKLVLKENITSLLSTLRLPCVEILESAWQYHL